MSRSLLPGVHLAILFIICTSLGACIDSAGIAPQARRLAGSELLTDQAIDRATTAAGWPPAAWWQAYADPQLDAWMQLALADNPSLASATARVRQAQAMALQTAAGEAPQLGLAGSLERKRWPDDNFYGPGPLSSAITWNNSEALSLSYDLDLWGRERSNSQRALDLAQVAAVEARAAALELQGNLLRSYVQLALHFAEQDIATAALKQQQQLLQLARQRREIGLGTQLEISQAEVPWLLAQRQLAAVQAAIALSRNQLAALAGKGPGAGASLQRPRLTLRLNTQLPSNLPLELLGRRPDVVARRWQVAAQARGIEVAQADFYPNINLRGSLGSAAVQGGLLDFLRADKLTYGMGPALSLPIFDGGRLRGQLGSAAAGYDLAVAQYNQTLIQALQAVSDQLIRLHSLQQQQQSNAAGLLAAEQNCQLALLAEQRGLSDFREVLHAQSQLFQLQYEQQRLWAAQLNAQAELWLALGGGVLPAAAGPADAQLSAQPITSAGAAQPLGRADE